VRPLAALAAVLLFPAPVLAGKMACVEHGERLYAAQYYFAGVHMFRTISQPPANPVVEKWMKLSAGNGYGKAQLYMATVYRFGNALTDYWKAQLEGRACCR